MTFLDALLRSRVRFRRNGNEIGVNCPFCPERRGIVDTNFSCHVNVKSGAGKCWHDTCGFRSWKAVIEVLAALRMSTDVDAGELPPEVTEPVTLPKDFLPLTKAYDDLDRQALAYVRKRGISPKQIEERRFGVSYVGRLSYRVVMPVYAGNQLKAIVARDFTGRQEPKYLNSRGDKWLFGFDPAQKSVVLAEGIFKSLRIELSGRSAAALLGHDLTDIQLKQLTDSACEEITLWPDVDHVGRRGVRNVAEKLLDSNWKGKVFVAWPVSSPADEMRLEDLRAVPVKPYCWGLAQELA